MTITLHPQNFTIAASGGKLKSREPTKPASVGFSPQSGYGVTLDGGAFADGGSITIIGSGFGTKANAKPMYFWDSKGGSLASSPLSRRSFTLYHQNGAIAFATDYGVNGRGSLLFNPPGDPATQYQIPSGAINTNPFYTNLDGAGTSIRLFARRRRNYDGLDAYAKRAELAPTRQEWNYKYWRWWAYNGSWNIAPDLLTLAVGQANTDRGSPRITPEYTGTTDNGAAKSYGHTKDLWLTDLAYVRQSSGVDVPDAYIEFINNDLVWQYGGWKSRTATYPNVYERFYFPQPQYIFTNQAWAEWYDCFYLDDSAHAVIVTDGVWGSAGTKYEIAIPTAWADGSVSCVLRGGEFASLSGKNLYVVNGANVPALIGQFT